MLQKSRAVLISIHPEYVKKIIDGSKRVEFRRVWTSKSVTHLVIYSTYPEMKIKAIAEIDSVVTGGKNFLWEIAKKYGGGITRDKLRTYFSDLKNGNGILIKDIKSIKNGVPLSDILPGIKAPQSFIYLTDDQFDSIKRLSIKEIE